MNNINNNNQIVHHFYKIRDDLLEAKGMIRSNEKEADNLLQGLTDLIIRLREINKNAYYVDVTAKSMIDELFFVVGELSKWLKTIVNLLYREMKTNIDFYIEFFSWLPFLLIKLSKEESKELYKKIKELEKEIEPLRDEDIRWILQEMKQRLSELEKRTEDEENEE